MTKTLTKKSDKLCSQSTSEILNCYSKTNDFSEYKKSVSNIKVRNMARHLYPLLFKEYCLKSERIVETRLFGIIPILKTVSNNLSQKIYLFGFIPLYKTEKTTNYKDN